ncbi:MAG: hypothetical protein RQ751_03425 [Longimicrobiales bacterium]|nr:hypothetical protein [Longimicrobiales bacterium]
MKRGTGMNCERAREILWPPERPRVMDTTKEAATVHLGECAECARYFGEDRRFLEALNDFASPPVPLDVRERVFMAVAEARAAARPHRGLAVGAGRSGAPLWFSGLAGAAALLALVGIALVGGPRSGTANTTVAVAADYLRRTVSEEYLVTGDPREAMRFLERELGLAVAPLQIPGLDLERVEICLLDGTRGAMIQYRMGEERVSHYLVPTRSARARAPAVALGDVGKGGGSLPVVTWSAPGVEHALVSEAGTPVLMELALGAGWD